MSHYPRKPVFGDPCNQCGLCCLATPCPIALDFVPDATPGLPCPALRFTADRKSRCGLVEAVGEKSVVALALGIGDGCDSGPDLPPHTDELYGVNAPEFLNRRFLYSRKVMP